MRHRSAPYRLALAAATFVAAAVASYAQTALPILTRELYLQSNSVGNPLIQISAPSALGPAYSLILPPGPGNVGDVLTWSASTGALVWEAPSTGSWALLGNSINTAGTGAGEVFLGTRNTQPLILATTNTVTPQPMLFLTGNTERMRILANGNVGIGIAIPTTLLDVAGTFRATGSSTIGGTLTLSSVAQGVAGDSVLLINASNEVTRTSRSSLIASMGWALTGNAGTTALQYIGTSDAQPLSIRTDGVERLRILSTGQIGIGVPTPTSTLEVGGTLRVNTGGGATSALTVFQANPAHTNPYIRAEMNDGTAMFTIGSDGSLFARGSLTIDALGGTATSPTPAGYNRILIANASGQVEEASINAVVAEGIQANAWALRGNSAALDAGAFVGQPPEPTGNYLGTTGTTGLSFVTDSVIRVQISSLGDMTVQFDMRVNGLTLGKGGGGQLTNTALGRDALRDNTTGERNTAMGNQSLMASRFGSSNTSVGSSSQTANFSGSNNTSFGSEALASVIASDNNVAVGAQTLYATTGSDNTAVGHNALRNITASNGNIALGALSGSQIASGTELLTATNSIFIGNDARANASGQSNQIVIGHGAVGIGTNSVVIGNNTTESTRLRGRLGVGVNPAGGVGDAQVQIRTATAASMGLIVRGILNQTGNLFELQDSLGIANLTVTPNGSTTLAGTLTLNSVASGLSSDSVLLINASNQVTRTSRAALFAGSGWALTGNANTSALNYLGTSDLQPLSIRTNATERIRIATDGKTGIGVSTPLTRLHVSNGALLMDDAYEDYDSNAVLIVHKTPTAAATLNDPLPLLYLAREGTLDEAFAAGVEMSLSRYEDVAENSRTRFDIALANDNFLASKNTVMTMRSAGFVGINNTAPTVALDITGGLRATGTVTLTNVAQGVAADSVLLINASNQVTKTTRASLFAGSGWALVGNGGTTESSSLGAAATGNFVGTTDARSLSFATNNIVRAQISANGALSTQSDIVVNGVTVGRGANGIETNTSVGLAALATTTTGTRNVAIGDSALVTNTTFTHNTMVGSKAGLSLGNGGSNTAIGASAMMEAGSNLVSSNIAMGVSALRKAGITGTTGENVAIGWAALLEVTAGSNNIALGRGTGGTIAAMDQTILIGSNTQPAATGQSNQIVIGHGATGLGSNTALLGNSSITATRLQGRVGIGANPTTAAGDAQLQVTAAAAANRGLTITGAPSQSANLIDVRDNLGASMFTVNSSGNVAINNPVAGGSTTSIAFGNQGSGHGALLVKNATLGSQVFDFYFGRHSGQTGAQLRFWRDQATEVMRIMGTGEVGIGVFPPVNRLDVGGTFGATGLATLSGGATITGTTNINVTGNANTTIGSATTTGTTTIATNGTTGRVRVTGLPAVDNTNTDNVMLVDPATGNVSRTTRADLFAGSGWSLTGNANTTNTGNLGTAATGNFIGTTGTGGAARSLSFVTDNTVQMTLGTDGALRMSRDIFTGWIVGATGVRVGSGPGNNYNNTVLGAFAYSNVSAANAGAFRDNVAVGFYALRGGVADKAGNGRNVAVGSYAVSSITDGASNVGVGTEALLNISTGSTNVAIGNVALQLATTGGNNVALGAGALSLLTTGSSNVAIGANAGRDETGSNKLYIANSASNNLIYGDFSAGLLSINAGATPTAPGASLQVNAFSASTKGLIVRGAATATANLAEFQNSGGTVLASINASGLLTATAGINLSGAASPLQANGSDGTSGQVLVSAGAGATPTWANAQAAAGIKSKGRSAVLTAQSTFVITGLSNVDVDDGVSIVLESDNDDMDIPPYFIKRVASPTAGSITVRFSAPFTGYVTWVVVD